MGRRGWFVLGVAWLAAVPGALSGQDARAAEIMELNRRILQEQIVARDATLFQEVALEQFRVVAPGGRIEDKAQATRGVNAWNARSVEVRDEEVLFHEGTAILLGRLQIDGEMNPVGTLPPMKFMAVFVETDEGWRLLARSLTPCFEMAIQNGFC